MITIFHGDDLVKSRQAYLEALSNFADNELLKIDNKVLDLDKISVFLNSSSFFNENKVLCLETFFSLPKVTQDKLKKIITSVTMPIFIWHDKSLTATQLKVLPEATLYSFKGSNPVFACINSLRPHNLSKFQTLYSQVIKGELFDLFFYLLKANLRKQLFFPKLYPEAIIQKTYLQLIELEFQHKTGQLTIDRQIALNRVLLPLLK